MPIVKAWEWIEQKVLSKYFSSWIWALVAYVVVVLIATYRSSILPIRVFDGVEWTGFNNYLVFKYSFYHLIEGLDLYQLYPSEHADLFKYSPAFALFMGVFAWMPDWLGLFLWNLLNALVLFFSILRIPGVGRKASVYVLWFLLVEFLTATHNDQANGLMAGLLIMAFTSFENKKVIWATLWIVCSVYIKLFGIVAGVLFLFYNEKMKFIVSLLLWGVLFAIIPVVVVSWNELAIQYQSWLHLLTNDYSSSVGLSVQGWLAAWFRADMAKEIILFIGSIILCLPLIKISQREHFGFRLEYFAAILIWVIIFNHKAEGATFIVAMSGVGLWFFYYKPSWVSISMLVVSVVFTSFSDRSGIFPEHIRTGVFRDYVIKAIPCILVWILMMWDLLKVNRSHYQNILSKYN